MRTKRPKQLWLTLLIALPVLTALTFAASNSIRHSEAMGTTTTIDQAGLRTRRRAYVRRNLLSPKLAWHLNALGDRLEKAGKERLSVTGTLSRASDSQTAEVIAVFEFPERLRLTMQKGNETRFITLDGEEAKSTGKLLEAAERDLVETLVYGSAEHFFSAQMQGQATRFLGSRFRIDESSTADYNGPYYEIYKVADQIKIAGDQREQLKLYYFNSDTLLLERVCYEINRNGTEVKVEERIGGWTRQQGQQIARRIERFENGESVFVLTVRAADLSSRVDDGLFSN